ncbi:alanine racemase [Phytoactinopolyspora endophytica]|uniref:alanine racemase n=1 Tax=Phytoactinopolyspora endophytica TaxID=1642495 RepID=UPI0013EDD494|nr:alanine racemase [Phytoactinopolyspora endophytica]
MTLRTDGTPASADTTPLIDSSSMRGAASTADDEWLIDWRCKSFPPSAEGVPASQVAERRWHVHEDFSTPVALLKERALAHNLNRMREYCAEHGVHIAPHGKTTMSPELIRLQLEHGAWGMTAATAWQARAMLAFGARRVLIANECIDPVGLRWIAAHMRDHPQVEVLCLVDSTAAVEQMRAVLREVHGSAAGDTSSPPVRPMPVLVEIGVAGGRAGARDVVAAVDVGRAVSAAPELELAGVAGFEGVIGGQRVREVVEPVRQFLGTIRSVGEELMAAGAFRDTHPVILSAGGSAFFDQVVDVFTEGRDRYARPVDVVIRSGCYVTHDHVTYRAASPFAGDEERDFRPAIEVWARVISTPEPGLAIIDAGKRDISTDGQMPVVLGRLRDTEFRPVDEVAVDRFNDQHGYLATAASAASVLEVGDRVALGISHPCTTFDKWRVMPVVDDDYTVTAAFRTTF